MKVSNLDGCPYDAWAPYYDLTDADRAPFIEFYQSLVTESATSCLDLGCGTGTITIALSNRLRRTHPTGGIRVVGVDQSSEMLKLARAKDDQIDWIEGDMSAPPLNESFDLIVCPYNGLQLLVTDDDLTRALHAVRNRLSRSGSFAFDIYQPNTHYLAHLQTNRMARAVVDASGQSLEIRENSSYDAGSSVLTVDWRLVRPKHVNAAPLAQLRIHMRQYFRNDLDRLLAGAGLAVRERFGDLDRSPFTPTSRKQVIVCEAI